MSTTQPNHAPIPAAPPQAGPSQGAPQQAGPTQGNAAPPASAGWGIQQQQPQQQQPPQQQHGQWAQGAPTAAGPQTAATPPTAAGPQTATAGAPTQPNAFVTLLVAQLNAALAVLRGYPLRAFQIAASIPRFALLTFVVLGALVGIFSATNVSRGAANSMNFLGSTTERVFLGSDSGYDSYSELSFGVWIYLVITLAIVVFVVSLLRAAFVYLTFTIRGRAQPFATCMQIVSVANLPFALIIVPAFVLILIPSTGFVVFINVLVFIACIIVAFLAEIIVYVGINRAVSFDKSPALPHVIMTLLCGGVATLAVMLVMTLATFIATN